MIVVRDESLPRESQERLARWLQDPAAKLAVQVVESEYKRLAVLALKSAVSAAKDGSLQIAIADANIQRAARYQTFLDVFQELAEPNHEPFTIAKLT